MVQTRTLAELAEITGATLQGDGQQVIEGVAPLERASQKDISFVAGRKYLGQLEDTKAAAVILPEKISYDGNCLISNNPYVDFVKLIKLYAPQIPYPKPGIHPSAIVDPKAHVADTAAIGPFCVIGEEAVIADHTVLVSHVFVGDQTRIGESCIIYPQVTIRERVTIRNRVILHPGVSIGADGFGYAPYEGVHYKIPQIGTVVIEEDVELGANTTVDRAALCETKIAKGSKIDNLVMVAHNVEIGSHTVIAGQAGLSGSTKIGNNVMIGGQAGTAGHITIGNNVIIGGQSGVTKDVADKQFINGYPAKPHKEHMRQLADIGKIADLRKQVKEMEKRIEELEQS